MTADSKVAALKADAIPWHRGNRFEDFTIGRRFVHHWGRTVTQADSHTFSILTLHYNPTYTNESFAIASGHPSSPINPLLVFNTVFGLTVEDLSEGGGPFLGVNRLVYGKPVYPGDTLCASSEVLAARLSDKRPGYGIVTWKTVGVNQRDEVVLTYERSNLVRTRA
jgi:itaconyl-CoA hydratase